MEKKLTKTRILDAAEELILEHGVGDAAIAKIAKRANVADSLAYKYFKGKDDIIFSVVAERTKEEIALLQEHLRGHHRSSIPVEQNDLAYADGTTTPTGITLRIFSSSAVPTRTSMHRKPIF